MRRRRSGEHEDAGSDNGPDSQRHQVQDAQGALQSVLALLPGFLRNHPKGLANQYAGHSVNRREYTKRTELRTKTAIGTLN